MFSNSQLKDRLFFVKKRATKKRVPCDLTLLQLRSLLEGSGPVCPCCKLPYNEQSQKKLRTLDRIEPALGYTYSNLQILCGKCNRKKGQTIIRYAA